MYYSTTNPVKLHLKYIVNLPPAKLAGKCLFGRFVGRDCPPFCSTLSKQRIRKAQCPADFFDKELISQNFLPPPEKLMPPEDEYPPEKREPPPPPPLFLGFSVLTTVIYRKMSFERRILKLPGMA